MLYKAPVVLFIFLIVSCTGQGIDMILARKDTAYTIEESIDPNGQN
ncbi:MAG: hypothetical protein E7B59_09055 [Enterobacteriaceae bacterium]|nr:hypothetical protein [Enterobacteriaceae bacterium]